ncbi:putative serine/threonine protein kinase [Blattamonas nauphoetae]|uniref:non-specific serine/threonine protein kinase n=1 Tax=Blattamonas nauphoetae TaxID=2049346 RepID=A0ABQ9YFT7_9EUKA|nr:putative serine/threonine protein kinase [Blattamonas nauphoetae]
MEAAIKELLISEGIENTDIVVLDQLKDYFTRFSKETIKKASQLPTALAHNCVRSKGTKYLDRAVNLPLRKFKRILVETPISFFGCCLVLDMVFVSSFDPVILDLSMDYGFDLEKPITMSTQASQQRPGVDKVKRVGNYLLGKTIGFGSFGKVKLSTHTITGEKVAAKILDKERIHDIADMERITREINVMKLLNHPNVVKLYEVIDTQRHIYIITELISGGELFDYIVHHGKLKEREACRFFHMLMNGVDFCHQFGVIHRDLKPENLMLDNQRNLKIIDFGLSNRMKPGGLLKTACGSPCYAAPEMIEGKMYDGRCSDVWSCGVILFALVCGFLPFEDQNTQALYQKILHARYRCPSTLSAECRNLISKILEVDPTKRYTIAQIRQHPWYIDNFAGQTIIELQLTEPKEKGTDIPIDEVCVNELAKLGYPAENTVACIKARKHNQVVASYRLLLEKKQRQALEAGTTYTITPYPDGEEAKKTMPKVEQTASVDPKAKAPAKGKPEEKTSSAFGDAKATAQTVVVVTEEKKKPEDQDEKEMEQVKKKVTAASKRRHSLFPNSANKPNVAVTFTADKKPDALATKDKDGNVVVPAGTASLNVQQRKAPVVSVDLAALPDDDEEEVDLKDIKPKPVAKAAAVPAAALAMASDDDGEEMPAELVAKAKQQRAPAKKRMSIANTGEAAKAYTMREEAKAEDGKAKDGQKDVRIFRGMFNVSATSTKPPDVVIEQVLAVLQKRRVEVKRVENSFVLKCHYPDKALRFEIEICRLPRLDEVCFVNMKRVSGETFVWKEFCTQFFSGLQL